MGLCVATLIFVAGLLMYARTGWMLELTAFFESMTGAMWAPTERTYHVYRFCGLLLLVIGAVLLGYFLAA